MYERDLLPASNQSAPNFIVYPQYSRMEDRVASLKDFCTASTKRLLTQYIVPKQKDRTLMLMDYISHYSFLNLCIVHNQANESRFLSLHILYRIN